MTKVSATDGVKVVHIIADSRESRAGIAARLRSFPGVSITQEELSSGDYVIAPGVAVERKAATDFVLSLMEGRLFDQLARMSIDYERVIVLVEGNVYATNSMIAPHAIDGALSYIALLSGAVLVHSVDIEHTPRLLHRMAVHAQHGLGYTIPMRSSKPAGDAMARYLLEGLPSVGPRVAQDLLAHFGSPRAVFAATRAELMAVKGLGPKSANAICAALDTRPA